MAITARFYVNSITHFAGDARAIKMNPAYANGANKEWAVATPSGSIELYVQNPAANAEFEAWLKEGKDIAITFEPVDRV